MTARVSAAARAIDAQMSAEPGRELDVERSAEVAAAHGFAVFDPAAPGGVRAPLPDERAQIDAQLAVDHEPPAPHDTRTAPARQGAVGFAATEQMMDEIAARTADPTFAYDPAAEWGEPGYREPRSDDEAAARTAHVNQHSPTTGWVPRTATPVQDALEVAQEHAVLAERAHDPDPEAWAAVERLEAVRDLRPVPDSTELRRHVDTARVRLAATAAGNGDEHAYPADHTAHDRANASGDGDEHGEGRW